VPGSGAQKSSIFRAFASHAIVKSETLNHSDPESRIMHLMTGCRPMRFAYVLSSMVILCGDAKGKHHLRVRALAAIGRRGCMSVTVDRIAA
jgi:hypothetical protein